MRIGLFLPNWIGDAVMATPALRAIRRRFADAEILGVVRPPIADVLAGLNLVDHLIEHDSRGADPQQRGWRFVRRLRSQKLDMAILLPGSFRTAFLARLSGAKRRVGIARDGRRFLLTDRIPARQKKQPHPVIDEYLRIAAALECRDLTRHMELAVLPQDEARLAQFWHKNAGCRSSAGVICLNPGGAFGSAKHWPVESFAGLARRMAAEVGRTVLVLCGPAEREQAQEIAERAGHSKVLSLASERPSIGLTKAAVKSSELLVTTDSGPRHFAPPFGTPVITLFGPTHVDWSETFYPKAVHLQLDVDCGPCQQRVCPLGHHRCMRDLTVEEVYAAVRAVLRSNGNKRIAS